MLDITIPVYGGIIGEFSFLRDLGFCGILGTLLTSCVIYNAVIIVYRLYFSPLAKFPGSKFAAATPWYETFIDLWYHNFPDVLADMHKKYGMWILQPPCEEPSRVDGMVQKARLSGSPPGSFPLTTPTTITKCM